MHTHTHAHICSVEGVYGSGTIDKGVLACGKGNHGAGAWVARVRLSAHTVWMWSSFPLQRKLLVGRKLPVPRSLQTRHSSLGGQRNLPTRHMFPAVGRPPVPRTLGAQSTSLGVQGLWWRPVCWPVEVEEEEEGWCRHTGGTGTVAAAGTADTVGTDAVAGSTLRTTCSL